ncbi:MAG TPA: B-box zinc finger protein [Anaerolineales bacterium]|nr:B-box zinc finger protein [Anaerolineales bacterium]
MTEALLTCYVHPDRPTKLRCNRCNRLICVSCAIQTPVGYRCRECVRGQQQVFETAGRLDFALAGIVAALCAAVATPLLSRLGFWGFLFAPVVGGGIAEIVRAAVRRRRSRRLPMVAGIGAAAGVLLYAGLRAAPFGLLLLGRAANLGAGALGGAGLSLLWPLLYGGLMVGSLVARLQGIRL